MARRWRLDEVVTNVGKPSELHYLVRIRKSVSKEDLLTAFVPGRSTIIGADVQLAEEAQSLASGGRVMSTFLVATAIIACCRRAPGVAVGEEKPPRRKTNTRYWRRAWRA